MNNLVSKFETMTAVDRKYQYVWKGRITALTTGEFLYLDGSATKELPFMNSVLYKVSANGIGRRVSNGDCDVEFHTGLVANLNIFKDSAGVYETIQNNVLNNIIGAFAIFAGLMYIQGAFVGNRYEFEVTTNQATDDYDVFLVVSLDEVINVAVYTT